MVLDPAAMSRSFPHAVDIILVIGRPNHSTVRRNVPTGMQGHVPQEGLRPSTVSGQVNPWTCEWSIQQILTSKLIPSAHRRNLISGCVPAFLRGCVEALLQSAMVFSLVNNERLVSLIASTHLPVVVDYGHIVMCRLSYMMSYMMVTIILSLYFLSSSPFYEQSPSSSIYLLLFIILLPLFPNSLLTHSSQCVVGLPFSFHFLGIYWACVMIDLY